MSPAAGKPTRQQNLELSQKANAVVTNAQIHRLRNGPDSVAGLTTTTELIVSAGTALARRLERRYNKGKVFAAPAGKLPKGSRAGVLRNETESLESTTLQLPTDLIDRVRGLLALFAFDQDARAKEGIGIGAEFWTKAVLDFAESHKKKTGVDLTQPAQ